MSRQLMGGVLSKKKSQWLYKGQVWEYGEVLNPITGRVWMDRNLGASRVATSSTDALSYGDYVQGGRLDDLHQNANSLNTNILSTSDVPDNGGKFITNADGLFSDWRNPSNNLLWQNGLNVPAPDGWDIPTQGELEAEIASWTLTGDNLLDAYNSVLKLPQAGLRTNLGVLLTGSQIRLWSKSNTLEQRLAYLWVNATTFRIAFAGKIMGASIRLIKKL